MGNLQQSQSQQNTNNQNQQPKNKKILNHKYVLQIRDREIILDYKNKVKLMIGDVLSFPSGGFEGLHLWDANVVLARYIIMNKQQFAGKSVIQLLAGTGIASIALKKFTSAAKVAATDRSLQVTSNISKNCQKNDIHSGMVVACISWSEYTNYKAKFDLVIGADLLFKGCPIDVLQNSLDKLLNIGGKALIISPQRNSTQDSTTEFLSKLDYGIFNFKKQKLHDQIYMESPLLNQVIGFEQFKMISQGLFYLYTLQKIKQKQENKQKAQPTPNKVPEPAYLIRPINPRKQQQQKQTQKLKEKKTQQFTIKQSHFEIVSEQEKAEHLKRQLQIVKINKKQDVPEYQRKKRKDLNDILESQESKSKQQSQNKSKQQSNDGAEDIQEVHKQHNLYDQPQKKSETDRKSIHSQQQPVVNNLSPEELQQMRMRKKSNPH